MHIVDQDTVTGADALRAVLDARLSGPRMEERSVKISHGHVETDRLLVSVMRRGLYPGPRTRLARLLAELGAPDGTDISDYWPGAVAVHFGAEGAIRKCYLEYRDAPPAPGVVFHAVKWWQGTPRTDRYIDRSNTGAAVIDEILPDGPVRIAAQTLLTQSAAADPAGRGFLLEVVGQGDARRSVDVNLAHCRLTLGDMAETLRPALHEVGGGAAMDILQPDRDARLGHFAAGYSADGIAFVTVYFGARPT